MNSTVKQPPEKSPANAMAEVSAVASQAMQKISVGDEKTICKTISESDVYLYAGIIGDLHPNHTDAEYAGARFGGRVMHGALLPGFISRCTVDLIGDRLDPPGYAAQSFGVKCVAPILIGDTISVRVTVADINVERRKITFDALITNQDGETCAFGDSVVKVLRNNG